MGLIVDVYTRTADEPRSLTLVDVDGPFEPTEDRPAVMLVERYLSSGGRYVHAEIAEQGPSGHYFPARPGGAGPMFGGSFIYTSDSRFGQATGRGHGRPIPLHNRFEGSNWGVTML